MLTAEIEYSVNFSMSSRKFCLSFHLKRCNSFSFVNATKIYQFKGRDSEIKKDPLCLGNISKYFTANNLEKKTGLSGCVYNFFVGYNILDTSIIINIHENLMKKHDISDVSNY